MGVGLLNVDGQRIPILGVRQRQVIGRSEQPGIARVSAKQQQLTERDKPPIVPTPRLILNRAIPYGPAPLWATG